MLTQATPIERTPRSPASLRSDPEPEPAKGNVTLTDLSLKNCELTDRVQELRRAYFDACPEVCVERPDLVTRAHQDLGLFDKNENRISILDKARVYRRVLESRAPVVWHTRAQTKEGVPFTFAGESLFAGSTTTKLKGVVLYPEFLGLALWPELQTMSNRPQNPYKITPEEAAILNEKAFPPWLDRSILEWTRTETKTWDSPPNIDLFQRMVFFLTTKVETLSHTIPSFERAIHEGLGAIRDDALARKKKAATDAQCDFYEAVAEVIEGIIAYSNRLAGAAEAMAGRESDPRRKKELEALARIHRRVPERRAETFREGLTSIWMCWIAIHLENSNNAVSLGRLDQLLYDLYRRDIEAGAMTVEDAIELCGCFWLKIGDHVPTIPETGEQLFGGTGSNQAITIGGVDKDGKDAVNDLTYVILRATELMRLRDPNLNARFMPGVSSPEYLRRLCEANVVTGATPALHNDRAVIEALTARGETLEQARDYGVVGCVEPCSAGRHYGHTGAVLVNLTAILELTLFNGRHRHTGLNRLVSIETGDPATFASIEDFWRAFEAQLRWMAGEMVKLNNALGRTHQAIYPTPIMSALFEGPMEKGKDVIEGGATINSSAVTIIGLADTADSISAIQKVVFEERSLPMSEMLRAITSDYKGYEALQVRLMNPEKTPKWGNEDPLADGNVARLIRLLDETYAAHQSYRGGSYRVGYWTMTNHAGFGRMMGALPSGRRAHASFTSGFTPVSGVTPNLTAALNSVGSMPARHLSSGVAFNLKFTPDRPADKEAMLTLFAAAVEGYFRGKNGQTGGMEIQFNVTKLEKFKDAQEHPEDYPELLVRVSGYTAYFKDLNKQMQDEIIERTEYELSTGKATKPAPVTL